MARFVRSGDWPQELRNISLPTERVGGMCLQEVLAGVRTGAAGSPMTMADATRFADNALEHMVRTLGAALAAPQILESTQGALRWDGLQYERRYRRLLSPPLHRLLTQPGGSF